MNHKKSFKARTKVKIAEKKCSEYLISKEIPHHEFGFDPYNNPIPTKEFYLLPETIRSAPDLVVYKKDFFFLEVKGCKDVLRLKKCDMKAYGIWNKLMSVWFFIYSSLKNTAKFICYKDLNDITKYCEVEIYEDNRKEYYKVDLDKLYNK